MNSLNDLVDRLSAARSAYYAGRPVISDAEYDILEDKLHKLDPTNKILRSVGSTNEFEVQDVTHEIPMLSMEKCVTLEDLDKWWKKRLSKVERPFKLVVEPKIDGFSCELRYTNGVLTQASSRGDGTTGSTLDFEKITNIPMRLSTKKDISIRGELFLPKKFAMDGTLPLNTPLRNHCVGMMRRKDRSSRLVHFVAYEVVPFVGYDTVIDMLKSLKDLGFLTVEHKIISTLHEFEVYFDQYLNTLRNTWMYETDGLILTICDIELRKRVEEGEDVTHHHRYDVAFKPPPNGGFTEIIDVAWNVSRNGKLTPVASLKPVKIGDVTISNVTLNGMRFLREHDIMIGDKVFIVRANDVIPKLVNSEHTSKSTKIVVEVCPECGSKVSVFGADMFCDNLSCPSRFLGKMVYWFNRNDIKNFSEESLRKFIENTRFDALWKIYKMSDDDVLKVFSKAAGMSSSTPRMQEFLGSFSKTRTSLSEFDVIARYGIPNVSDRNLKSMNIRNFADLEKLVNGDGVIINRSSIADSIRSWWAEPGNAENLRILIDIIAVKKAEPRSGGIKYCVSGKFDVSRSDVVNMISRDLGWEFVDSVTKDINVLIIGGGERSSKWKKATSLGIKIVEFQEKLDIQRLKDVESTLCVKSTGTTKYHDK